MARLEEICAINMGQSPDSSTYNEDGNGLPFFQGNADFGEIYPAVRMWCSEPTKIAREKDILISVRAPIGALNIANCECCIGRGLAALTVNEDICAQEYLWHVLSGKVDELNSKGTGSTFKAINGGGQYPVRRGVRPGKSLCGGFPSPAHSVDRAAFCQSGADAAHFRYPHGAAVSASWLRIEVEWGRA